VVGVGAGEEGARKPFRWGYASATAAILFLMLVGQAVRTMLDGFGAGGLGLKDALFLAFLGSSLAFAWLQRAAVVRFFRTMQVGVALVGLTALSVLTGVLVPQIDGFEDPRQRVTAENDAEQYQAFRWAEGYFLWHLLHLYGLGTPEGGLDPRAVEGLARFSRRYGFEEGDNTRKLMEAASSGQLKTRAIGAFIDRHDAALRRLFDVCTVLQLNRTYKSYWFASLLMLLFCGVLLNTFRGPPAAWLSARKAGWFTVHVGVMTLLAGGLVSNQTTVRGILHLDLREPPKDEFWANFDRTQKTKLPFHVKLDRFARRDWKTLEVVFADERFTAKPPAYTLWPGRVIDLDYVGEGAALRPRLSIEVLALHERAQVLPPTFWEAEAPGDPQALGPLAVLEVSDWEAAGPRAELSGDGGGGAPPTMPLFLKPDWRSSSFYDPLWRFRLRTSFGNREDARALLAVADEAGVLGRLSMRVASGDDVQDRIVPVRLGETVEAPGGYAVRIAEATADFRVDPSNPAAELRDARPLAQQYPRNPAVWVKIRPPGEGPTERRPVLERLDAEQNDLQSRFRYPDLVLKLEWERWLGLGPPRYVLHWGPGEAPVLLDEQGAETPVVPGRRLPLPGDTEVVPRQLIADARFEKHLAFPAATASGKGFDESFYATDPTGVELAVTRDPGTPTETVERVRLAATDAALSNVWEAPDGAFWIHYFENDKGFPFEWRSVLSIWEPDASGRLAEVDLGPEAEREIRVNDYLYYKGYRLFQTNAIPELPSYSGIGVVHDLGIPIVLAGMYTIIAGAVLAFLVRPIVEARARSGRRRREGATWAS
jgi:hypothetical protein